MIAQEPTDLSSATAAPAGCIQAVSAGEWIAPELLQAELLAVAQRGEEPHVDTASCHHLTAGILQVLLSWSGGPEGERTQCLVLTSVAPELLHWLELAGATHLLAHRELEKQA